MKDILYIFVVLLAWVCIIKTKITNTLIVFSYTKVHANRFRMTNMKIAIWLWRETCLNTSSVLTLCEVFLYQLFYEAQATLLLIGVVLYRSHIFLFLLCCKVTHFFLFMMHFVLNNNVYSFMQFEIIHAKCFSSNVL